tara:strand:+ start:18532 stop:19941 length:1410 start_codon:yes stop_codon:yes gene_type:complete
MKLLGLKINNDILILGIGNIPRFVLLVLYSRFQTYFLDYENLSKFYLAFSIYTFFSFIIIGPIGNYITRNVLEWYKSNNMNTGLALVIYKIIVPIALIALILISLLGTVYDLGYSSFYLALVVSLIIITKTSNELIFPVFNLIDKNIIYLSLIILFHILNPVASILIIKTYEPTFIYWLSGLIISNFIVAIIGWRIIKKLPQNDPIKFNFKELKSFSYFIMLGNVIGWMLTDGFRFIAENQIGLTNTGILILGLISATQIFSNLEVLINQFLIPKYLQKIADSDYELRSKAFNKLFNASIQIYLIVALLAIQFSDIILNIIIDKSKINDMLLLVFVIGIFIELTKVILNILRNISTSEYKTKAIVFPFFIGVIVMLIGFYSNQFNSIILIAFLILISYMCVIVTSIISFNRIINIKVNFKNILNNLWLIILLNLIIYYLQESNIYLNIIYVICSFFIIYSVIEDYKKTN